MCMKLLGLSSQQNLTEIPPKNTPRCLYLSKFPAVINAETCSRKRNYLTSGNCSYIGDPCSCNKYSVLFFQGKKEKLASQLIGPWLFSCALEICSHFSSSFMEICGTMVVSSLVAQFIKELLWVHDAWIIIGFISFLLNLSASYCLERTKTLDLMICSNTVVYTPLRLCSG